MSATPLVIAMLDPDFGFQSRILEGLREEARQRLPCRVVPVPSTQGEDMLEALLERGDVAGVVGTFPSDRWLEGSALAHRVRIVNVGDASDVRSVPSVVPDSEAVGRLAARHLLETGATAMGLVRDPASRASELRANGFAAALAEADAGPALEPPRGRGYAPDDEWGEWAAGQPRPLAVFCTDDFLARRFLRRVLRAGLRVPEDVAIVGVGDSPLDTALSPVALSSVRLPAERVGAEALRRLLRPEPDDAGNAAPTWTLPPDGIAVRESSALRRGTGPLVARALAYWAANMAWAPDMADVARACHASRRSIEMAFRRELGHSPGEEFRRMRLERARQLLAETELPLAQVADACGYGEAPWFWTAFRKATGMTPAEYRSGKARRG